MNGSLASRIRLLVLCICAGFGAAVLVAFYGLANRQVTETIRRDSRSTAGFLSWMIKDRAESLNALTRFFATDRRLASLASTDDPKTVEGPLGEYKTQVGVDGLALVGRTGKPLGAAGLSSNALDSGANEALKGHEWHGIVERDGTLMVASAEPLKIGEYLQGAVIAYRRLDRDDVFDQGSLEVAFVHNGHMAGGSSRLAGLTLREISATFETTFGGRTYAARYATLPDTTSDDHMGFVVLRPVDELLGPYRQMSVAFVSILGLIAACTLLAGSAFSAKIAKSLGALVEAAHKLQRGEWPEQLAVERHDEVGLLQTAFNEMSVSLQDSEARLMAMIDLDPLTELDNHRRFKERLEYEAARTSASGESFALLFIDIDGFAHFNECHGHAAGDRILKQVAQAIKANAPELAEVARYGSNTFAVVFPGGTVGEAKALYHAVRAGLNDVTISAGCAELSAAKGKTEGLVVAAELALTCAKQSGRNQVRDFEAVEGYDADDPSGVFRALQDGTYATIRALAAAVDAKDPYTQGHSERVARYAADLAGFVGADPQEVDLILRAGTLHDVGKIGVPDAILQKPGKLDEEEFRTMQAHPVLGELIVSKVPQLAELLPGIRHHHERYDGRGYPDRLAGDEIPRVALFLALADTFDAMTSDRPYRKGMAWEAALTEIERGAGSQFEPDLARAFVEMMDARRLDAERRDAA